MKPDLDAIRARWPEGRLANTAAREDVLALLAYIDELEGEQRYVEMREESAHLKHREVMLKRAHGALADAGCVVPIEFDRTIEHAINALAERALIAEERLERVTRERDQDRTVFEQAMAEAQTDARELRTRSIDAIATRLRGTVCSFAVGGELVMVPGEQVAALLKGFIEP